MRAQRQRIKLLELGGADEDEIITARGRYMTTSSEYVRFSKEMGLSQQRERVTVDNLYNIGQKNYYKPVEKSTDSGIIVKEESPRKNKMVNFAVDWSKIQSVEYNSKFKKLSNNDRAVSAVRTRAKWALNNRDGLDTEEIYAVDLTNGDEISKITNQHYSNAVKRTPTFIKKLNKADKQGKKVLLIHNHPKGLPPSISDINALLTNENVSGITVGHNGSVYHYTKPRKEISESDWNIAMRHYKEFSEVTAMEKALNSLMKIYRFTYTKL